MIIDENGYQKNKWNIQELVDINKDNTVNTHTINLDFESNKSYKIEYLLNLIPDSEANPFIYLKPNNIKSAFWLVKPSWHGSGGTGGEDNIVFKRPSELCIHNSTDNQGMGAVPSNGEFVIDSLDTSYGYAIRGYGVRYGDGNNLSFVNYGAISRLAELEGKMKNLVFQAEGDRGEYPQWYGSFIISVLGR